MSSRKSISNTFTVITVDDPVSVEAQYSPDKSIIHSEWQDGDIYMRTRESDSSVWSSWHLIVGENGGETDFSFAISSQKTTESASTSPSDIGTDDWADAPVAITSDKPYLWARVQQKSWNSSTQSYTIDSTRYIRLTGEDGYTVQAQYAPNDNPTESQIHTTWQAGDLYMRTKQSNETQWSSWHKIVGESGDETDYSFGISQQKVTSSASIPPSDIADSDWADAPMAVTTLKPFLWSRVQKKVWNASTQDYVVDSTRYIRLTGENGVSITSADVVFGLSTSETTAPSPDNTTTWKTSIADLSLTNSDKNKYIWQCTKITYSNKNTVYTGKMCLGIVSSFADIVEQYAIGTASSATGTWQDTTPPSMANGYYLWTRTKLVYSDNSVSYAPSSNGYCVGYYGVDGTSITGANVWYALSTSNSSAPQDSDFTLDDFPTTLNAGYYVWEATKITFSSESHIFTGKMCLGATSDFLSGTEVYAISTSNSTVPADNQFGTTYSKTKGYYLWTATRVQYTNGNYGYLNKKCVGYWGEDGVDYEIRCAIDSIKIPKDTTSTSVTTTFNFYYKESGKTPIVYNAYYGIYYRIGTAYTRISSGSSSSASLSDYSIDNTKTAIVVFLFSTSYSDNSPMSQSYLAKLELPIYKDGDSGQDGKDGLTSNPNILLRTVFDRGIDKVKEKWTSRLSWNNIWVDNEPDTTVSGHKSIRIVAPSYDYENFAQRVYERLGYHGVKVNTWYTLSFYSYSSQDFNTYVYPESSAACIDTSLVYVDGVAKNVTDDGKVEWSHAWSGVRHTFTFRTLSTFPTDYVNITFRCLAGGILCISMPKLEEGKEATPYVPNDGDLIGNDGNDATFFDIVTTIDHVRIPSNATSATLQNTPTATFYKIVGDNRQTISLYWSLYWRSGTTLTLNSSGGASTNCNLPTVYPSTYDSLVIFVYTSSSTSTTNFVAKREISIGADGNSGERGAMSRNIYFAGKISEIKGTTFSVDDYQAPYVDVETGTEDSPNCYVFIGNNGSYTFNSSSSHYNNASEWVSGEKWTMMNTEFKYIITNAVFSQFAKLGSGIFNKDWLFSQYGNRILNLMSYSQAISKTPGDWTDIASENSISVKSGVKYTIVVEWAHNSEYPSSALYVRTYYKKDGENGWTQGRDSLSTTNDTRASSYLTFIAEYDGVVKLFASGYGTLYTIKTDTDSNYENSSPSFINEDSITLTAGVGLSINNTINNPRVINGNTFILVNGLSYNFSAICSSSTSEAYVEIYRLDTDSRITALTFSSGVTSNQNQFTSTYSGKVGIRAYLKNNQSSQKVVNSVTLTPVNPFIPKVAIDWFSGYAHFGGDSTRFNPDGSGKLANGNIKWTKDGDTNIRGVLQADMMYSKTIKVMSLTQNYVYNINPEKVPSNIYNCEAEYGNLTITLPQAGDYDGVEFRLLCSTSNKKSLYIKCGSDDTIFYVDDNGGYGWTYTQDKVKVRYDCMVVLQNVSGTWYVVSGKVTTP